jgi:hypothetical protein
MASDLLTLRSLEKSWSFDVLNNETFTSSGEPQEKSACAIETTSLATPTSTPNDHSPLLELPAELRNLIYEYAVTEPRRVCVDDGVPEPPLALFCKQIRHESLPLFYTNNDFCVHNYDYNSAVYKKATQKSRDLYRQLAVELDPKNCVMRQPHWSNLKGWLEGYYNRSIDRKYLAPSEAVGKTPRLEAMVIGAMFKFVHDMGSLPWERLQDQLEEQQLILAKIDERWE